MEHDYRITGLLLVRGNCSSVQHIGPTKVQERL